MNAVPAGNRARWAPIRCGAVLSRESDCELRRGTDLVSLEPQVFDLLEYLLRNRERVVSKDDLIAAVWGGRAKTRH